MKVGVGSSTTLYRRIGGVINHVCDCGDSHAVNQYYTKRVTIFQITREHIPALNYTSDGIGEVRWAIDRQGRVYRQRQSWDGWSAWETWDDDGWVFSGPTGLLVNAVDVFGRPIDPSPKEAWRG